MNKKIFKGFVPTKGKRPIESIRGRAEFYPLEEVKHLESYGGVLKDDVILVDSDDDNESDILFKIIQDLDINCNVIQTTRGKHFYFKNTDVKSNKIGNQCPLSLTLDYKLGTRNTVVPLKINGVNRKWLQETNLIDPLPIWLIPIGKNIIDFSTLGEGDGRNQTLFNYILKLQSEGLSKNEIRETITIINKYILEDPLPERELETILRDEAFQKPVFFKGTTFLFDKFSNYLKNEHYIIKINNQLHIYKDGVYQNGNVIIEGEMIKHISNLNRAKRNEVLHYLNISINENKVQSNANLIAFNNGSYNLIDDSFSNFSPDYIITNKIPWDYNPNAYSKLADNTLDKIACHDEEIRALLEEVIGYTFYRRNELGKAFIFIGDKSNGKSTYLDMISTILGQENISALDLKELGERFKTAELFGKLANIGDDIGDEFIANPSVFKKLVTGDRINVEKKGQDPFDFNNYSKLLFSANNIPRMKDRTGAVQRRLVIIPFNAKFSKDDPDYRPYIKYELREEESIQYLINVGLKGLKRILENRQFTKSSKVEKELEEYEESNNPVIGFVKDVGLNSILENTTSEAYLRYQEYCVKEGLQPLSNREFGKVICGTFNLESKQKWIAGENRRVYIKLEE